MALKPAMRKRPSLILEPMRPGSRKQLWSIVIRLCTGDLPRSCRHQGDPTRFTKPPSHRSAPIGSTLVHDDIGQPGSNDLPDQRTLSCSCIIPYHQETYGSTCLGIRRFSLAADHTITPMVRVLWLNRHDARLILTPGHEILSCRGPSVRSTIDGSRTLKNAAPYRDEGVRRG
jgi:hypothetical protein